MDVSKDSFRPDKSHAGEKSKESQEAVWAWFSPVGEPRARHRYAVIKEEEGVLSIQPDEGRFKKGLKAVRYDSEEEQEGREYVVLKTRPNRIDLQPAP